MYTEAQQLQESNFLKILFCILSATKLSEIDRSEGRMTKFASPSYNLTHTVHDSNHLQRVVFHISYGNELHF